VEGISGMPSHLKKLSETGTLQQSAVCNEEQKIKKQRHTAPTVVRNWEKSDEGSVIRRKSMIKEGKPRKPQVM